MQPSYLLIPLISASTILAFVLPADHRLEDIQCRCLSIPVAAKPTPCTYMDSHKLDWHTASSFAYEHNLKLHFASQDTVSKILSINRPLPSSVLLSIGESHALEAQESEWMVQSGNRIVCGFGDEVEDLSSGGEDGGLEAEEVHFVSHVLAGIMVLVGCYVLVEWAWKRFFATGTIKLDGDEKALLAASSSPTTNTQDQFADNAHHADFS